MSFALCPISWIARQDKKISALYKLLNAVRENVDRSFVACTSDIE